MPKYLAVAAYFDESNDRPYAYHWTLEAPDVVQAGKIAQRQHRDPGFLLEHYPTPDDPIHEQGGFDDVYVVPLDSL